MIYKSERFNISLLQPSDALQLNKLFVSNTDRFYKYLPKTIEENTTLAGTKSYIARQIKAANKKKSFVFVIHDPHSKDIIGMILLKNLDWKHKNGEFAYCIGRRFKGQGLMADAVRQTCRHAIEILGLKTLEILVHKTNASSINVALKSGFKWKHTLQDEFMTLDNTEQPIEVFEFSDHEK